MTDQHLTAIVWFRRDLRLADNPALTAALQSSEAIIPLFIDDRDSDEQWRQGAASDWWLHHSLTALEQSIADRGATLVVRRGEAQSILNQLVEETGATAVYWNRLYEPFAVKRDTAIKQQLTKNDIAVESHNGSLLIEPWDVKTKTETPYRVFTPFWREAQKRLALPSPLPVPDQIEGVDGVASDGIDSLDLLPTIRWDTGLEATWTPGEAGAAERAAAFVAEPVRHYDERRDLPGVEGVSRLSPHLHWGEISARALYQDIVARHGTDDDGSKIYLTELGWREFSHHILFHYPETSDEPMNAKYAAFPWRENADELIHAWQRGRTG
ncbi:MAG: deoxyribodipyrimidine photo-lyase, partial [Pseudomonadota bacterium]